MSPSITRLALQGFLVLGLSAAAWPAYAAIGTFQFTFGDVKVVNVRGEDRAARKGTSLDEGETVVTGAAASAQLKMVDGGVLAVRPETQLKFDAYRYPGREDGTERGFMSLVKGGFRTITGAIGRLNKPNYRVITPTATVGIRGTDHEVIHIPIPAVGQIALGEPGTYDKVNVGAAYIRNPAGTININPNQVGFAPPVPTQPPVLLPRVPDFFRPAPPPAPQKAQQEKEQAPAQRAQQQPAAPSAEAAPEPAPEPIRSLTVMDNQSQITAIATDSAVAAAAPATPLPSTVAAVTPAATSTSGSAGTATGNAPAIPVTLTDASGLTVNATQQTVTTSTGESASVSQGAFAVQAQTAADLAAASAAALNALVTGVGAAVANDTVPDALGVASSVVSAAASAVNSAASLTIDTAAASSNAASVAAIAQTAQDQANAALSAFNANGAFADPIIAATAMAQLSPAAFAVQSNATSVQTAANNIATQANALSSLLTAAGSAASAMNALMTTADNALTALTSLGFAHQTTTAQSLLLTAQNAASAAQAAASEVQSLQNAGNFTEAQALVNIALQHQASAANALAAAQKVIEGIAAASAAQAAAGTSSDTTGTAFGFANAALAAVQSAAASLAQIDPALSASAANLVQTNAQIVADNYLKAQYSNPAVAGTSGPTGTGFAAFAHGALAMNAVPGGVEIMFAHDEVPMSNIVYVLDENKNLVEIRSTAFERSGFNYDAQIGFPSIKFSGGTPQDHYQAADGTAYMGRWQGGQVSVDDAGIVSNHALGNTSAHWLIGHVPGDSPFSTFAGPINNVQRLIGTSNYSLVASTKPTDSLGNVGTLNSASLTANFTAQTVDAGVNLSFPTRDLTLDAKAQNVPIDGAGFAARSESPSAPTITCTGSGCAQSYDGEFRGGFTGAASAGVTTGAVGTGAGMLYAMTPLISNPIANQPLTDLIQGAAVFGTATAPSVGINSSFADNTSLRHRVVYPISTTSSTQTAFASASNASFMPNTNYLFDASGNLARVHDSEYSIFITGSPLTTASTPSSLQFPTQFSPFSDAQVSFGLDSTAAESFSSEGQAYSAIGLRMGRWQGGSVNVTDLTDFNAAYFDPLGNRSAHWVVAQVPSAIPTTGQFHYTRLPGSTAGSFGFATAPTDAYGNVGVLDGARLNVDFTNLTVNAGVRARINSGPGGSFGEQDLRAFGADVLTGGTFNIGSGPGLPLNVSCFGPGCAPVDPVSMPGYGGRIAGALSGLDAEGAFFRYTFNTSYATEADAAAAGRVKDDFINGMVGFQKGPQLQAPSPGGAEIATSYFSYTGPSLIFGENDTFSFNHYSTAPQSSGGYATDASGNLTSVTDGDSEGTPRSEALGGTLSPAGLATTTNGISFGRYAGNTAGGAGTALEISGVSDFSGPFGSANSQPAVNILGDYHWIKGPEPWPFYLSTPITGTATYAAAGNTPPTDQNGVTGTLGPATLSVNFDRQSLDTSFSVNFTTPAPREWIASAFGIRLDGSGGFRANADNVGLFAHDNMSVTLNGFQAFGGLNGALTGAGLDGAVMSYAFGGNDPNNSFSHEHVNGVIAFQSSPQNTLAPYVLNLASAGMLTGIDSFTGAAPSTPAYQISDQYLTWVEGEALNPSRIKRDSQGRVIESDSRFPVVTCSATSNCFVNDIPVRVSINPTGSDSTATLPPMSSISTPATIQEFGHDRATGISWGRWGGGDMAVSDRIGFEPLPVQNLGTGGPHFIVSSVQSGPTVLPVSGTASYTLVGNTKPTDTNGNIGTLNSATLNANFTAQTVDTGVNLSIASQTWNASATGVPIQKGTFFEAAKSTGGTGPLSVTCAGTGCGATSGRLVGAFTGPTGRGAGIAYSLNQGGVTGSVVSGVAAFKR